MAPQKRERMMFIRNAWYVGAWSHELDKTSMLSRRLLGDAILFFRTTGIPIASRWVKPSPPSATDAAIVSRLCRWDGGRVTASAACITACCSTQTESA